MKIVIQRVKKASVCVSDRIVGSIKRGVLVFLGISTGDTKKDLLWLSRKLLHLRMFADDEKKMNLSIQDILGEILVVSQFTLYADCEKGRRPSFIHAANPKMAKELYQKFIEELKKSNLKIETGVFGALMEISLINDGPVTFIIEAPK